MKKRLLAAALTLVVAAACSQQQQQNASNGQASSAPIANPLDFPLYGNAKIVSSHDFTQNVNTTSEGTGGQVMAHGNGTYKGHEVIAATPATFAQLSAWARGLDQHPPQGYAQNVNATQGHDQAQRFGLDYASFQKNQNGKPRGVLVVVMDPAKVNQRMGPVLKLISTYKALPQALRGSIDDKVKAQTGMTVGEAMAPDSPIGAALGALDDLQHSNARGIVVLDATKQ
ncbi:MAG: hypothetical protein JO165_11755 [Candidatus Eremiobacteraeota bacterium]|nr:hypothetical protein [Candidatus Eremiobacteraeota bacterium]